MAEPIAHSLQQEPTVERSNYNRDAPGQPFHDRAVDEFAHLHLVAGEHDEWENGEAQLETEDYLAQDEKLRRPGLARNNRNENRRNDGDKPGNEAPKPGSQPEVEKTFHDDLSRECPGEGGILARGEK